MVKWTEEEERVLTDVWKDPKISSKDLPSIFLGRSLDAIRKKADSMALGVKAFKPLGIDYEYLKALTEVKEI